MKVTLIPAKAEVSRPLSHLAPGPALHLNYWLRALALPYPSTRALIYTQLLLHSPFSPSRYASQTHVVLSPFPSSHLHSIATDADDLYRETIWRRAEEQKAHAHPENHPIANCTLFQHAS